MKRKITAKQPSGKHCFVCGVENEGGLGASFYQTEDGQVACVFTPSGAHQGFPGRLHGGIASSILDEVISRALHIDSPHIWGVTAKLELRYKKPLPLGVPLRALGRITNENRHLFDGTGEIYTPDGEVAVTAVGKFVKMDISQITDESLSGEEFAVHLHMDDPEEIDV